MTKILGIDYGRKRIGLAVSDALGLYAHPRGFIPSAGKAPISLVLKVVETEGIEQIVVGLPRSMSGRTNAIQIEVEAFIEALRSGTQVPVEAWDERLTSAMSERILIGSDMRRSKRKKHVDEAAAMFILQSYLDRHKG